MALAAGYQDSSEKEASASETADATKLTWDYSGVRVSSQRVTSGQRVTVTPVTSGDLGGATYNYVWSYEGGWDLWGSTVKDDGKATAEPTGTLSFSRPGRYVLYVDVTDRSGQKRTLSVGVEAYDDSWSLDGVDASPRSISGTLSDWSSASSVNFSRNAFTSGATAFEIFLDVKYPNGKQPSFAAEVHASGWYTSGGSWHYSYSSGIDATGWAYINGSWYYFNGSGVMQTGWLNLGGKSYYLDPSFGRMATGFDAGSCFDPDGSWLCYSGGASSALRIARSVGSPTNCLLLIDNSRCTTWVFKWVNGDLSAIHKWICSPGKASMPTVRGTYSIGLRGYSFGNGFTCYYWTQFYGNYLFHSILYYQGTRSVVDGTLGVPASHGCVRLDINNAYWINQNIPSGTRVYSY